MARTVIVFRDNALEREQLAVTQQKSVRERAAQRGDRRDDHALREHRRPGARKVRGAAGAPRDCVLGTQRRSRFRRGGIKRRRGARRRGFDERCVCGELGGRTRRLDREISTQAATSTDVASRAVTEAQRTVETCRTRRRREPHREVIGLIQRLPARPTAGAHAHRGRTRGRSGTRLCGRRLNEPITSPMRLAAPASCDMVSTVRCAR